VCPCQLSNACPPTSHCASSLCIFRQPLTKCHKCVIIIIFWLITCLLYTYLAPYIYILLYCQVSRARGDGKEKKKKKRKKQREREAGKRDRDQKANNRVSLACLYKNSVTEFQIRDDSSSFLKISLDFLPLL